MASSSDPKTTKDINFLIEKLTIEVDDLKKRNVDLSIKIKALNKFNEAFKEELSTVKDELKHLKTNHSIHDHPNECVEQNPNQPKQQISGLEGEEPSIDLEDFTIQPRALYVEEEKESNLNTRAQNEPNPALHHHTTISRTQRFISPLLLSFQGRSTQFSSVSNMYNTNTLFMFAASVAYQHAQNPTLRARAAMWTMAFLSVLFLGVQVFILQTLQLESAYPTCTKHSDCQPGWMCNGFGFVDSWNQPRCETCSYLEVHKSQFESLENLCDVENLEDFFESSWFDSDFKPNVDMEANNISDIFNSEEDAMKCITEQYCQQNSPVGVTDQCFLVRYSMEKASGTAFGVLLFMSILFAVYIYKDTEEAEVENALLDFIISSGLSDKLWISMFILRLTNRARRFILPFYTAMAGASIILSEDLTPKNITLNLLALIFIIEADNLIAVLVISEKQREKANDLVEDAKRNNVRIGKAEIKLDAVLVSVLMFVVVVKFDSLVEVFFCEASLALSYAFIVIGDTVFMIYKFLGNLIFGEKPKKWTKSVLVFLWIYIGSAVMVFAVCLSTSIVIPDYPYFQFFFPNIVMVISSICVVFRPQQILADSYVNSWKNKVINVLMTLVWLIAQGWGWQRTFAVAAAL